MDGASSHRPLRINAPPAASIREAIAKAPLPRISCRVAILLQQYRPDSRQSFPSHQSGTDSLYAGLRSDMTGRRRPSNTSVTSSRLRVLAKAGGKPVLPTDIGDAWIGLPCSCRGPPRIRATTGTFTAPVRGKEARVMAQSQPPAPNTPCRIMPPPPHATSTPAQRRSPLP